VFRSLWVLPDAASLILLAHGPDASAHRGGATVVGEVHGASTSSKLVLVQLGDLDVAELSELVRGNARVDATRATALPEVLDPALGCLAPLLAVARRLVVNAREGVDVSTTFSIEAQNLPGGTVECARIEALRLHPGRRVEILGQGREPGEPSMPLSLHEVAPVHDDELTEALALLTAYPAQFRSVIDVALGFDELYRLNSLLKQSTGSRGRRVDQHAGRVVLRAAPNTPRPNLVRRDPTPSNSAAPRPGTPAARAVEKVAAVPRYHQGRAARGAGSTGKLSANESPFGPPPAVRAALTSASENLNRYPEEGPVLDQLARHLGIDAERLVLTNGSDELCYLLARLVLDDAPSVAGARRQGFTVVGDPCYQIDATASTLAGAPIVRVPLIRGAHDLDAMTRAARDGATLVWLPSPHNPTGVAVAREELVRFLDEVPGDCLVVLDEAYGGFTQRDDPNAALTLGEGRPNLLVQRTFSKDWGLAGLRVGYAVGDATLIDSLRRARPPFSVNALALAAVSAVLGCEDWRASVVAKIIEERTLLELTLEELGVTFFPSEANFVTCALTFSELRDALESEGLSVRDGADLGLPGWTRITVGWAPQMAALRDVLRRHVATHENESR
jgi:histidinol-phosphate aminotransferase